jgi:NAD(P)-dependent dehydrogenase (short-subunit alcohol dehydrogenase family)
MVRAVAPEMRDRRSGAIVNLSSVVGWLTLAYTAAYGASKHAVESLSEGLWFELAPFGVRVAVVEPGAFPTNLNNSVVTAPDFKEGSPHWANAQRYRSALQSIIKVSHAKADPQEVADLVFEAATTSAPKFRYVAHRCQAVGWRRDRALSGEGLPSPSSRGAVPGAYRQISGCRSL